MVLTKLGQTGNYVICYPGTIANCKFTPLKVSQRDDPLYSVDLAVATRQINAIIDSLNAERAPNFELAFIPDAVDEDFLRLVWRTLDPDEAPEHLDAVPEPEPDMGGGPG